jgi:hypothetical protein
VGVVSGYSQNRNSDGTLAPIVYTTHTSGINTSDTDGGIGYTADSIVIIVPANIVELTAGGIQIANDTNTFTKFVRYDSPAGNMMLGQVKNGYLQLNPYNDDETQYSIQSYGTIYAGGGLFVGGSEDLSGNWEYGGISLSNTQKSGNIRSSIYLFGDLHPANTNWGVSGGPHISTRNMGSNSGTGVYWDEIYADNFNNLSDIRIKENIYDSDLGLDFINNLRPVKYNFKNSNKKRTRYGFIAQEVLSALTLSGKSTDEFRGLSTGSSIIKTVEKLYGKNIHEIISSGSITGSNGTLYDQRWYENEQQNAAWNLSYTEFISPMIKAIQELSKKVSILEAKLSGSI